MNPNGPIESPDLRAVLNAHRDEVFAGINCHQLGTIISFDAAKQTATVSLNSRRVVFDRAQTENGALQQQPRVVDYPLLTDVPVFVTSGGTARLTLPIVAGDTCLVLFNDRDIDAWWASGQVVAPNSPRMHSLSDGLALVGFRSLANALDDYEADNAVLRLGDSVIRIKPDGAIEIAREGDDPGSSFKLNADGSVEIAKADGTFAKLTADGLIDLQSKGGARLRLGDDGNVLIESAAGGYLSLGSLTSLSTNAGSLKTALDAVVTALTALNSKTGPSAATQIASAQIAINAVVT